MYSSHTMKQSGLPVAVIASMVALMPRWPMLQAIYAKKINSCPVQDRIYRLTSACNMDNLNIIIYDLMEDLGSIELPSPCA